MSKQPYLREFSISHFRGLRHVKFENIRRISLIGGLNGVGKSTVLDAIFQFVDTANPALLFRSAQFKQIPTTLEAVHRINEGAKPTMPGLHRFVTKDGTYELTWKWGRQKLEVSAPQTVHAELSQQSQSSGIQEGYSLTVKKNSELALSRRFISGGDNGLTFSQDFATEISFPSSVYMSKMTINNANDIAKKYSQIVQRGLKKRFLSIINSISIQFDDVELLQPSGQSILYLSLGDVMLPLAFAGDGIATIAAVALSIMTSTGGIVVLDEFDASVHYSILKNTWSIFHSLCVEFDTQLVVATHSRECVLALFEAIDESNANDVAYFRIDLVDDENIVTRYDWGEMREADAEGWEFR